MNHIWVNENSFGGIHIYMVMRGHEVFDEMVSSKRLTWAQQNEMADYYREALDNYTPPVLE